MTAPPTAPVRLDFETPAWLHDHTFTIREISEVLGVPFQTIAAWLNIARHQGRNLTVKRKHRRLVTGHGCYQVGLLAALHKTGIAVSPDLIAQTHRVTHPNGEPALPSLAEQGWLAETDLDGAPIARIELELWAIWASLEQQLADLVGDTSKDNQ